MLFKAYCDIVMRHTGKYTYCMLINSHLNSIIAALNEETKLAFEVEERNAQEEASRAQEEQLRLAEIERR